jgi:hypothetical protein
MNQRNPQCQNIAELTSANVAEWRRFPLKLIKKSNCWLLQMEKGG